MSSGVDLLNVNTVDQGCVLFDIHLAARECTTGSPTRRSRCYLNLWACQVAFCSERLVLITIHNLSAQNPAQIAAEMALLVEFAFEFSDAAPEADFLLTA